MTKTKLFLDEIYLSVSNRLFLVKVILKLVLCSNCSICKKSVFFHRLPISFHRKKSWPSPVYMLWKIIMKLHGRWKPFTEWVLATCGCSGTQISQSYSIHPPFPDLDGQAVMIKTSSKIASPCQGLGSYGLLHSRESFHAETEAVFYPFLETLDGSQLVGGAGSCGTRTTNMSRG